MDELQLELGARIRDTREKVGIQGQELAARVNLDPSAISNIERGRRSVKSDELAAIAKALDVSVLALLDSESLLARLPIAPRSSSGTLVAGSVLARLTGLAELHEVLVDSGIPTRDRLPDIDVNIENWSTEASSLADSVEETLGELAPGDDRFMAMVRAIEANLGVDVLIEHHGHEEVLGASITDSSFSLIFINSNQHVPRALFTLAHELGHVLARDGRNLVLDDNLSARTDSERFANAFAANLLLPQDEILKLIPDGAPSAATLCQILERWGTSYETLIYRLHNLRIVSATGRDQLKKLGLRGLISQIEDQELAVRLMARVGSNPPRHAPALLASRAARGYREGAISARPLASLLGIDTELVAAAMELDASEILDDAIESLDANVYSESELYGGDPVE